MQLTPGRQVLEHYRIKSLLGRGAMGEVYLGERLETLEKVALKVLHPETRSHGIERFEREARLMARISHPNVVRVLGNGVIDEQLSCIVMEYVEGETLAHHLERRVYLAWPDALGVITQTLRGLCALHEQRIVHRDLKPDNIVLTFRAPRVAKILDFGIAWEDHREGTRLTESGALVGTPNYMSPEQLLGERAREQSDLYSVGLILYELLYGALPFGQLQPMKALMQRLHHPIVAPTSLPDARQLPARLERLLFEDLLSMTVARRIPTARDALDEVEALLSDHERGRLDSPPESEDAAESVAPSRAKPREPELMVFFGRVTRPEARSGPASDEG